MADAENTLPTSKKRAAGREISKVNPGLDDEEDSAEQETGTFKRASDEVLATRRIVKVRRSQNTATSSNPFAGIQLVPATQSSAPLDATRNEAVATSEKVLEACKSDSCEPAVKDENKNAEELEGENLPVFRPTGEDQSAQDEAKKSVVSEPAEPQVDDDGAALGNKTENEKATAGDNAKTEDKKYDDKENADQSDVVETEDTKDGSKENAVQSVKGTPLSFQQLSSSQNAFTGLAGTGFSASSFTFGSLSKDGSGLGGSSGSLFGKKADQGSFSFGLPTNGSSSLFNPAGSSSASLGDGSGFPSKQDISIETGEENDAVVFSAASVLFEFLDGAWKERGKGELKVNVSEAGKGKARLLMRARGNYRLILNANLYPDMKLTNMDKRGISFACMNSIGDDKDSLSTFALKFKDALVVDEFCTTVAEHKGRAALDLKTPENSPKAT